MITSGSTERKKCLQEVGRPVKASERIALIFLRRECQPDSNMMLLENGWHSLFIGCHHSTVHSTLFSYCKILAKGFFFPLFLPSDIGCCLALGPWTLIVVAFCFTLKYDHSLLITDKKWTTWRQHKVRLPECGDSEEKTLSLKAYSQWRQLRINAKVGKSRWSLRVYSPTISTLDLWDSLMVSLFWSCFLSPCSSLKL